RYVLYLMYTFFFQAEDGIRDRNVTGVQTCALPIYADDDEPESLDSALPCEQVDDDRGEQSADDRSGGSGDEARAEDDDGHDAAGVSAGGEADDVRRSERIAR